MGDATSPQGNVQQRGSLSSLLRSGSIPPQMNAQSSAQTEAAAKAAQNALAALQAQMAQQQVLASQQQQNTNQMLATAQAAQVNLAQTHAVAALHHPAQVAHSVATQQAAYAQAVQAAQAQQVYQNLRAQIPKVVPPPPVSQTSVVIDPNPAFPGSACAGDAREPPPDDRSRQMEQNEETNELQAKVNDLFAGLM